MLAFSDCVEIQAAELTDGEIAHARRHPRAHRAITIARELAEALGYGFVDPKYLHGGADEYAFRDLQVGKPASSWRGLRAEELEAVKANRAVTTAFG